MTLSDWLKKSEVMPRDEWILYHKTNKEALTVLCSVEKH